MAIDDSEWTRLEWSLWWYNEVRMAQEESDRLWSHAEMQIVANQ